MNIDPLLNHPEPNFALLDQELKSHCLDDYLASWLVIYFYPKDDTPGCTKQACNLRDDFNALKDRGINLLGLSLDSSEKHSKFIQKHQLPFPLLSDKEGLVAKEYQSLFSLGPIKFAKRHSFLIDPNGIVRAVFRKVIPNQHSQQILDSVDSLSLL